MSYKTNWHMHGWGRTSSVTVPMGGVGGGSGAKRDKPLAGEYGRQRYTYSKELTLKAATVFSFLKDIVIDLPLTKDYKLESTLISKLQRNFEMSQVLYSRLLKEYDRSFIVESILGKEYTNNYELKSSLQLDYFAQSPLNIKFLNADWQVEIVNNLNSIRYLRLIDIIKKIKVIQDAQQGR